jgi:hypothetical protein
MDSGATWAEMTTLGTIGGIAGVLGIATDPKISGVLYATSNSSGISKSVDFGNTWTSVRLPFGSPTLGGIFVDPANSQRLYVAHVFGNGCMGQNRAAIDCGLFKSVDAGLTWAAIPIPGFVRFVDFDRTNGDIYAGGNETGVGSTVLKSSDQGITWTPLVKTVGGLVDGPAVSVDPGAAGVVYALGDTVGGGGSFRKTVDGGTTWSKVTVPPYCTVAGIPIPSCPSGVANTTPQIYVLAYEAPPPPPAVSVTRTVSAASMQPGPVAPESPRSRL